MKKIKILNKFYGLIMHHNKHHGKHHKSHRGKYLIEHENLK
jgi:hypothetical protein